MKIALIVIGKTDAGYFVEAINGQGSRHGPTGFIQKVQRKRRCFNAECLLRREQADRIHSRSPC